MDTGEFFDKILPTGGNRIIAIAKLHEGRTVFNYKLFKTNTAAANYALAVSAQGHTVYHACNGYGEWYEDDRLGKTRVRTQQNVTHCRSIYDDIDVGKINEANSYNTRDEAISGLKIFLAITGMPSPVIVSSGAGIHLYWPMANDITVAQWKELSFLKFQAARHAGFKVDPAVSQDEARILRPVGSMWRKGDTEREVKLVKAAGPFEYNVIRDILRAYVSTHNMPLTAHGDMDNDDLVTAKSYPDSQLDIIAEHCAQIGLFKETGGISEPHWHKSIGVAKHCIDGEQLVHLYGEHHSSYSYNETEAKFNAWGFGPTTCDGFRSINPATCEGCIHDVKSPIQLGFAAETVVQDVSAIVNEISGEEIKPAKKYPDMWPSRFEILDNRTTVREINKDGVTEVVVVSSPVFWPVSWLFLANGTMGIHIKAQVRKDVIREFDIPAKVIGDNRGLVSAMAANGVIISNPRGAQKFMAEYLERLRELAFEKHTYTQLGWTDKGFLIGDHLIERDKVSQVRLSDNIREPKVRAMYKPIGSVDTWASIVNELYNRKHGEPYQYAICSGFGSVLVPLMNGKEWHGIPLALTSGDSGYGKSTVGHVALSIYGDPSDTMLSGTTVNGVMHQAGVLKNLPMMVDEVTLQFTGADMGNILYSLSNGKSKIRLNTDGTLAGNSMDWDLMSILTGNNGIMFQLTESKINPEATQMRVFEVNMDVYPRMDSVAKLPLGEVSDLHSRHQSLAQSLLTNHLGVAGEVYLKFIMTNRENVVHMLQSTFTSISRALGVCGGNEAKERFYAYHIACSVVGGAIAKKIGLVSFNMNDLRGWAIAHVDRLRDIVQEYTYSVEDKFAALLDDMMGYTLVTHEFDTLDVRRGKVELPLVPMRGAVKARCVLGSQRERPQLYIALGAFDEWCKEKGLNPRQFKQDLFKLQYIREFSKNGKTSYDDPRWLTKGVPTIPGTRQRVIEINYRVAIECLPEDWRKGDVVDIATPVAIDSSSQKTG